MSESSCFTKFLCNVFSLYSKKVERSVLNGKKREDVLPLLSLLCDEGTM